MLSSAGLCHGEKISFLKNSLQGALRSWAPCSLAYCSHCDTASITWSFPLPRDDTWENRTQNFKKTPDLHAHKCSLKIPFQIWSPFCCYNNLHSTVKSWRTCCILMPSHKFWPFYAKVKRYCRKCYWELNTHQLLIYTDYLFELYWLFVINCLKLQL